MFTLALAKLSAAPKSYLLPLCLHLNLNSILKFVIFILFFNVETPEIFTMNKHLRSDLIKSVVGSYLKKRQYLVSFTLHLCNVCLNP